jgi:hypothetical protein
MRALLIGLTLLVLGACGDSREPAEKRLTDIDIALLGAGPDAVKYLPEQMQDIETKLGALHAAFDRHDYASVLRDAPAVLAETQGLAGAAAARKAEVRHRLDTQWTELAGRVNVDLATVQHRVEFLSARAHRKQAEGIDLPGARAGLESCESLWSKAQGAFGNGNLEEAVSTAREVRARLDALAPRLRVELAGAQQS